MSAFHSYLLGIAILILSLGLYLFYVIKAKWWAELICLVFIFCLTLNTGYGTLGFPRPVWTLFNPPKSAKVLTYYLNEPVAIYVVLKLPTNAEPMIVSLPWSKGTAQELSELLAEQQDGAPPIGAILKMKPGMGVWSEGPILDKGNPPEPMPLKQGE